MPYSEHRHSTPIASFLSTLSALRNGLGNFIIPLLPLMHMNTPVVNLHGKQAIVTGANSGIGFETAKSLASMGAQVVLACRNKEKAEQARHSIIATTGATMQANQIEVEILDCASFDSVRQFVQNWRKRSHMRIDIIINNAGGISNTRRTTVDGHEDAYQSNHLSHVLLTLSLLQLGCFAPDARIVNVSSIAFFSSPALDEFNTDSGDIICRYQEGDSLPWDTMVELYARSKASQAVWSMVLQRKLQGIEQWKNIVVQSCHPGIVKSSMLSQPNGAGGATGSDLDMFKSFVQTFGIDNQQGAVVPVWLAVAEEPAQPELRGLYWDRMRWINFSGRFTLRGSRAREHSFPRPHHPYIPRLAMQSLDEALDNLSSDLTKLTSLNQGEPPELNTEPAVELATWRNSAIVSLEKLKDAINTYQDNPNPIERERIISTTAVFIGHDSFTDHGCQTVAIGMVLFVVWSVRWVDTPEDCLNKIGALDRSTASDVLTNYVKPLFTTAHPSVHLHTGRIKHNPLSVQNMYDEQTWKINGPGCWNVLAWVLSNIESDDVEKLWPLIIPPLFTLLDDYHPPYRIRGVNVAQILLKKTPATLLRRTGIDELMFKALRGALQNLTSDWASELLCVAMPCYLALVDLVLPNDDIRRFNKLSELVTDTIVPGWLYASSRVEVLIASVNALLLVVQALGSGSVRFLKAFIPQLTENLLPKEFSPSETTRDLQIASAECLLIIMKNGRPRMPHWRLRILGGVLRCWVNVTENTAQKNDNSIKRLKTLLIEIFRELLAISGPLLENEMSALRDLDSHIFSELYRNSTMLEFLFDIFSRLKKAWRQHYPADPPSWTQDDIPDLTGKAFLGKGAKVYFAGRRNARAYISIDSLARIGKGELRFLEIDLTSLDSIHIAALEFLSANSQEVKLDILVNNAAEFLPPIDMLTVDGYDLVFGVNCLGACFLTLCLLPCLLKTPNPRIVNMASEAHRWAQRVDYTSVIEGDVRRRTDPFVQYGQSKLGLMLFGNELHRRYHKRGIISVSIHPGTIVTNCYKHKPGWFVSILHLLMYPAHMGAITPLWAATSPAGSDLGGRYAIPWARVGQCESYAEDVDRMKEHWAWIIDQTERFSPNIAQFRDE
ncbi:WW domain-containing oxidoreductase [Ceratobasidium theobromae]|uniref:WW domain-containing oxidoreductase n=1 Tax=Ceratobasidium theobromae TaxID=1582974 RepID=A0A5N5QR64_9AGAM|nr:WW domain-containing oxidoreductase [Ceratobasidium theobromae]